MKASFNLIKTLLVSHCEEVNLQRVIVWQRGGQKEDEEEEERKS